MPSLNKLCILYPSTCALTRVVGISAASRVKIGCFAILIQSCACPFLPSQSAVFAVIGVLIDDSVWQLSLFCAQLVVTFILLVLFKPFANR